jgi:general secretion pathway protein L
MAATSDLPSPRPTPAWRTRLGAYWRWWTGELEKIAYERFAALRGASDVPNFAIEGNELVLVEPRAAVGPDTRIDLAALDGVRARSALQSLLRRVGETRSRVRLCLRQGEALVRRVAMPLATEENLEQVLAFEMDRLTPFRAEDVYFDYRVASRDAATGQLVVQLGVARRELVDARVERLRALGANVQGVAVRDGVTPPASPLDLLPSEQRGERETSRERMVQRSLIAAVLILFALALAIPLWQKRQTVIALMPLVDRAQQEAQATDRIARQLEREADDYNFLLARKHANYPVLAYVEEISRLLPDSTWLQQLTVKSNGKTRDVQMTGETTSSSKLIEILAQSKLLRNPAPRGTMTRGSTPNSERFMIEAEAAPRPLPEPVPVLALPAVAPSRPAPTRAAPPPAPAPASEPAPEPGKTPPPRAANPAAKRPPAERK